MAAGAVHKTMQLWVKNLQVMFTPNISKGRECELCERGIVGARLVHGSLYRLYGMFRGGHPVIWWKHPVDVSEHNGEWRD